MVVPHTTSLAHGLGRALLIARETHQDPVAAVAATGFGQLLFQGAPCVCECEDLIQNPVHRLGPCVGHYLRLVAAVAMWGSDVLPLQGMFT